MTLLYRQNESGQPWVRTSGERRRSVAGVHDVDPVVAQRHAEPGVPESAASCAGQSNPSAQYATSSRR